MRILFLAPQPVFRPRGTPFNVRAFTRVLCEAGHEVDLLTYPFGEDLVHAGLRHLRILRPPGIRGVKVGPSAAKLPLDALMGGSALRLTLARRYDCIHAVEEAAFIARILRRIRGIPYVYDMDSHISDQLRYTGFIRNEGMLRRIEGFEAETMRRAACVVTVCAALTEVARAAAPDAKIFQIEDAPIDDAAGDSTDAAPYGLPTDGRRLVVYTGNLESYQGIDLLMAAFAQVAARRSDAHLVLVGGAPGQVDDLLRQAGGAGIGDRVSAVGQRPPGEIAGYLAAADCLVSPRTGGVNTPLKIFTYMRSERPIVATDALTHTQVLDSTCAFLTPPTPEGFAAGIERALGDRETARRVADAAKERVDRDYSRDAFQRRVIAAYDWIESEVGARQT